MLRKLQLKIVRDDSQFLVCTVSLSLHTQHNPPLQNSLNWYGRHLFFFYKKKSFKLQLLFLNQVRWAQEASPDLLHMTSPAGMPGRQPAAAAPLLRQNSAAPAELSSESLPESRFPPKHRQTQRFVPSEHLGREEQRVTKSQAAAGTCYRKGTAAAGRESGGVRRAIELGAWCRACRAP